MSMEWAPTFPSVALTFAYSLSLLNPQIIGRNGPQTGTFFYFVDASSHLLNMRSITWMVSMLLIPVSAF